MNKTKSKKSCTFKDPGEFTQALKNTRDSILKRIEYLAKEIKEIEKDLNKTVKSNDDYIKSLKQKLNKSVN